MMVEEVWLLVKVLVRPLDWTSTVAAGSLPTQPHASPPFTRPFLSELVQGLIAMLSTMVPAFSLARLMTMPSFSAPQPRGNASFPLLFISSAGITNRSCFFCFSQRNVIITNGSLTQDKDT